MMSGLRPSAQRAAGLGLLMATLGGCAVGPDFVRPAPPDSGRYTREALPAATAAADGKSQNLASTSALKADWWRLFGSAQLNTVVQQALANNQTLQAAEASLRQSQDNLRAGYGVYFPPASAELDARRQHTAASQQGLRIPSSTFDLVTLSGTVSYALDVFGGERRKVEGLRAQADYQRYAGMAAYLALSANVVNTCIARAAYS